MSVQYKNFRIPFARGENFVSDRIRTYPQIDLKADHVYALKQYAMVLTLMLAPLTASADGGLTFSPVGEDRGLNVTVPVDLLTDRRGFLWVGSREGLYRYDGYRATLFETDADDPDAITDLDIRALYEDRDGIIWVATNTGGLNRFDPVTSRFTHYRHRSDDPTTISHDSVYGMAEGPNGDLWAGTQIGLNRIDRQTGAVTRYLSDPEDPGSLSHDYVITVSRDRQNVLWVATVGGGLNRYNAATDTFSHFDLAAMTNSENEVNDVFALAEDSAERLWIGTRQGLLRFDRTRVELENVDLAETGTPQPTVTEILIGGDDVLWVGTLNRGIIRVDPASGDWVAYRDYNELEVGGLAAQPQMSLALVKDLLFVGTWGAGLWAARLPDAEFRLYGADAAESGLNNKIVTAIAPGDEPGRTLIGSFGGGIQTFDTGSSGFGRFTEAGEEIPWKSINAIAWSDDDRLFLATTEGLLELGSDGAVVGEFGYEAGRENGIGEGYVTSLLPDQDGSLWVGVGGSGLHRLERGGSTFQVFRHDPARPASLSGNYITSLLADDANYLWVGTRSNGLNHCRVSEWSCQRFDSSTSEQRLGHFHVTALRRDRRGRIWVATDGGGLHEIQRDGDGRVAGFRRWTEQEGLISNSVMAIEEDDDGSLWVSTRHGLTRLDPDQGRVANYVEASGLPVSHFNGNASAGDERYIYFGSADGVLVIPRGRPFTARTPSPVRITSIEKIGEEDLRPSSGWVPDRYDARYRDMLAINFATLDFSEVPHQYEFRLGDKAEWTRLGQRNEVTFLNLAPGSYRFAARGRDVFGMWSTSDPLRIDVIPPFWMSIWFRLLVALLVLSAAVGFHRLRARRLENKALEIERLGALREQALEEALGTKSEIAGLTPRQKEVLQLIAEGYSTREIAERLAVSVKTVETHRAHLMDRLDIRNIPGLVRLAIRARLISPHE